MKLKEETKMRIRNWLIGLLVLGFVFVIASSGWGAPPLKINVQGRLSEAGAAVGAGESRNMTFTIYELVGVGVRGDLWSKTQSVTMGNNGVFDVILEGPPALEDQFFRRTDPIFLEISVGGSALTPAQELVSVPFAITSRNLQGGTVNAYNSNAMAIIAEVTAGTNAAIQGNHMAGGQGVRGSSPSGHGVYGTSGSSGVDSNAGVYGWNTAGSNGGPGVRGVSISGRGVEGLSEFSGDTYYNRPAAVYGENTAETNGGSGVRGFSRSGIGVFGETRGDDEYAGYFYGNGDTSKGLYGFSASSTGIVGSSVLEYGISGVSGGNISIRGYKRDDADNDHNPAIYGLNEETNKSGVSDTNPGVMGESVAGVGVLGRSSADDRPAVRGYNTSAGTGVHGKSENGWGVFGETSSNDRAAVRGINGLIVRQGRGVEGFGQVGVFGQGPTAGGSFESRGVGVYSVNINTTPNMSDLLYSPGVLGESNVGNGVAGVNNSTTQPAVYGFNRAGGTAILGNGGTGTGVNGISSSGFGLSGLSNSSIGVLGATTNGRAGVVGVAHGQSFSTDHWGGFYFGVYSFGSLGIYNGSAYCTGAYNASYALDVAEWVKVNDPSIENGDIIVLDKKNTKSFVKSNSSYNTLVAGIISTEPGYVTGGHTKGSDFLTNEEMEAKGYRMLALAGQVPTKVSAENGPIEIGDLLTTSNTAGYAMKATDPKIGTIVGKAMEPLASGKGKIMVLVTLQ
jgi:hypothetical protein